MCEQCTETQTQIDKFRRFLGHSLDALTNERLSEAIAEMEAKLIALHLTPDE